jgi:superfamily II DNA or RNA helicase
LQSIGRQLRLAKNKGSAVLYDISDNLKHKSKANYTLNHFLERLKIYDQEKFDYTINNIDLEPGEK